MMAPVRSLSAARPAIELAVDQIRQVEIDGGVLDLKCGANERLIRTPITKPTNAMNSAPTPSLTPN
jgi:hypothetical protein